MKNFTGVCPECGYPVADEDKFCPKCDEKLGPPLSQRIAEAAERITRESSGGPDGR